MSGSRKMHSTLRNGAALAAVVFLMGCEVGPDYKTPETQLPQNWVSSPQSQAGAIDQAWWDNFHDPVLIQLIQKAVGGNLDLQIAEARIQEARATRSSAFADLLPTGDLSASGNRQANRIAFPDASSSGFGPLLKKPFNTYQAGFDASWELDLFGGHRRELESATASLEASEASRDDVMVSLMAEIARTYIDIRQYQAQLIIAQETIASDNSTVSIARQRFQAGDAPRIDETQGQAELDRAKTQIPYYNNLLKQAEYSLDVLLGAQPGTAEPLVSASAPIPKSDKQVILAAPAAVIANRPDIRMAERKLAAATAQQGVAVAKFFPDVSLSGFFGLLNTNAGNLLNTASKSWMAGGNVLWPILSYGTLSANLDAANAQQQEAMVTYRKTIIEALSDVERSVTAYTEQEKYLESLEKSVAENRHATVIARERYKEGLTSFLEVLDAERTLYTSQSQMTEAEAQVSQDTVAVYKSLGGGWTAKPASAIAQ